MSYKVLFVLNALVAALFGLGFLFRPDLLLPLLGVTEQYASTVWAARFFGSAGLALGLILWFAKDADERVQKGMGWALLASMAVGLILTFFASVSSNAVLRQNTWMPIVVYGLFGLGYVYMIFLRPKVKE